MHVGMNRAGAGDARRIVRVPHARGDEPFTRSSATMISYEFPMHVGMNRLIHALCALGTGVPHARGDEPSDEKERPERDLSSPCTWG